MFLVTIFIIILVLGLFYWLFMSSYSQIFGYFPYKIQTKEKVIALTFDDGPNEPYTSELLDFLKTKNIKATFFLVGKMINKYPETVKKIILNGHIIGNHSLSHQFSNYFKSLSLENQISQNQKIIKKLTGKEPKLYRSPWLFRQPFILKNLQKNGLVPISGIFCHPFEVLRPSPKKIAKQAIKIAKPGRIIIFHDGIEGRGGNRQQTIDAVKITVDQLLKKGYKFKTVDQLLDIKPYK